MNLVPTDRAVPIPFVLPTTRISLDSGVAGGDAINVYPRSP